MSAFATAFERIRDFWARITFTQRVMIGCLASLCVAVFAGLVIWLNAVEYQVLYANLSAQDAGRVVKNLEAQKIEYKLGENGSAILVPADKVYQLRMKVASEGVIQGQGIGFEAFNDVKLGQTEFAQQVQYLRALQGEIARTLTAFPAVENAHVHIVLPRKSLFIEEQRATTASVVLKMAGGASMEKSEVRAVVNLLTMSVEGLDKNHISIADTNGKVLFQPDEEGGMQLSASQIEYTRLKQAEYVRNIETQLAGIVGGMDKIRATVNADLNFAQRTIQEEIYDPESATVLSQRKSEESRQGGATLDTGVPETNFRGDGMGGTRSTTSSSRETSDTNYVINKKVQNTVAQMGTVDRLTVAVVVDGLYEKDENGNSVFKARSDDEMKAITKQVESIVGYDERRGDVITVSCMPMGSTEMEIPQNLAEVITQYALRLGKPLLNALLAFLFLMMVVRPVVLALIRPKVEGEVMEGLEGLPAAGERLALIDGDAETAEALATLEKIEDIKAHAIQMSEQNMEQALGIIRHWLREEEPAKA